VGRGIGRVFLRLVAVGFALLSMGACEGKLFRNDHRITIDSPQKYSTVEQPLTVRWHAKEFEAPEDGHFLLFVDRDPQPPGRTIEYFHRNRLDIYRTDSTRFRIEAFTPHPGATGLDRNRHDVTVILVDSSGRRIGETAGFTQFIVRLRT
jgi:hypothetical protein